MDILMGAYVIVTLLTAVLFAAMILLLASKPKFAGKVTGAFIAVTVVGGLLIYGYGFAATMENRVLAVVRALFAVCRMYVGANDLSSISAAPLMQYSWAQSLFWVVHLLALYATASAAITTVGAEALKKLRLWLARWGQMNLIYGITADTLELGKNLVQRRNTAVVFADDKPDVSLAAAASAAGCVVRSDSDALGADDKFLRGVGINGSRNLILYALSKDTTANLDYSRRFLSALKNRQIEPEHTSLVILGQEDLAVEQLQVSKDTYGYGYVTAVREAELAARLLIHSCPPWERISFDENGKATEDFETVVIGFGQMGQSVLKHLVMNGQFEGSTFHAHVFAPDCRDATGYFACNYEHLLKNYDISFHSCDARSRELYDHLRSRRGKVCCVVLCTGSEKLNREIAEDITAFYRRQDLPVPVFSCSHQGVKAYGADGTVSMHFSLYQPELLSMEGLDKLAMILNHRYQPQSDRTALQDWMRCDYFSRQSCRASADFIGAMLRASGKTKEQAMEDWALTPAQLENLSRTEHLRWCAFHYCMGFAAMTDEEFESRTEEYRSQARQYGKGVIRIAKNMAGRTHACLVSWEKLKELSNREAAVTGKYTDYQDMDAQNVLAIPELLRTARETEGEI